MSSVGNRTLYSDVSIIKLTPAPMLMVVQRNNNTTCGEETRVI
jgi:hypothetical protein